MCKPIHVLIVEDEPLIIDVHTNALHAISDANGRYDFKIKSATNSDLALKAIDDAVKSTPFDLILLDISIPPSTDKRILSGEDLGIEIKSLFPRVKIVVFTSHNNNYRLHLTKLISFSTRALGFRLASCQTMRSLVHRRRSSAWPECSTTSG